MKRSSAIVLFGSLSLMIIGYLSWCCRPFYIRPNLEFAPTVPDDARDAVNAWVKDSGGYGPEDFTLSRLIANLIYPYDQGVFIPAAVTFIERDPWTNGNGLVINHPCKPYNVRFCKDSNGKWLEPTFH